jgi:hypothetical protein
VLQADDRPFCHHRFVWFDHALTLRALTRPFFFRRPGVEFAAGLTWHPDGQRLIVSFGIADAEAWLATIVASEVQSCLEDAANLPSGLPGAGQRTGMPTELRQALCTSATGSGGDPEPRRP